MNRLPKKLFLLLRFIFFYLLELVHSAVRIGWDIVTIKDLSKPGFIDVPLDAKSDIEITAIANLITFSPGTMVIGLSDDRTVMRVHTMFLDDESSAIADIKNNLEKRVLELIR